MQVVYLGSEPRKHGEGSGEVRKYFQDTLISRLPLRAFGAQVVLGPLGDGRKHSSESSPPPPRGRKVGVFYTISCYSLPEGCSQWLTSLMLSDCSPLAVKESSQARSERCLWKAAWAQGPRP